MNRKKSIDLLNRAAADELHAVHQYMYFHFHLDDQGLGPLAALYLAQRPWPLRLRLRGRLPLERRRG